MTERRPLLVAPDIFGVTPELRALVDQMERTANVVDPYVGCRGVPCFDDEEQAYAFFMSNVGLDRYTELVHHATACLEESTTLVGFSVGASAAWRVSGELSMTDHLAGVVAFYGSQIRRHTSVTPRVATHVIFPQSEASFSVDELMARLSQAPHVTVERASALHGFMNRRSAHFDPRTFEHFVDVVREGRSLG